MTIMCRHRDEPIVGKLYRVTSEADGIPLLNMIVCASCAAVAKSLLLKTEEVTAELLAPSEAGHCQHEDFQSSCRSETM